jgi:hypothetical protein
VQPFSTKSIRQSSSSFWCAVLVFLLLCSVNGRAQGFGGSVIGSRKKIVLHRKLPAAIHLTATTFAIQTEARDKAQADVAQSLSEILETELLKNDTRLHAEKGSPEVLISCSITHFEIPPPQSFTRKEVVLEKGHSVEEPIKFYKVTGALEVAYQVKDTRSGKVLDSDNLSAKYAKDFEEGSNQAADQSLQSKMMDPFKRAVGKKTEDSSAPPTPIELRQTLIHQVVSQIAMTLVNTDQNVEIYLARGKLDSANKLAESRLWSRDLETLETMPALKTPKDDAYRLYNIAVAYEALAYQSDDRAAAKKFIEQAAINYGKAIDAKPDEKLFLEPQNRIETAAAYYRRLDQRHEGVTQARLAEPTETTTPQAPVSKAAADNGGGAQGGKSAGANLKPKTNSATAKKSSAPVQPVTNALLKQKEPNAASALTNAKVIEMFRSGVDEENIVTTVRQAPAVQFDVSPDGQIELAKNGVKGKIVVAMRERARRAKAAVASQNQ